MTLWEWLVLHKTNCSGFNSYVHVVKMAGMSFFDLMLAEALAGGLAREAARRERPPPENVFLLPKNLDAWRQVKDACRKENMVFLVDITDGSSENCTRIDNVFIDMAREFDGLPFFIVKVGPFGTFDEARFDLCVCLIMIPLPRLIVSKVLLEFRTLLSLLVKTRSISTQSVTLHKHTHTQLRKDLGGVQYTPTILIGFYGETLKRVKYEGEAEIRNGLRKYVP